MRVRTCALLVAALVALTPSNAFADDNPCPDPGCHLKTPSNLTTDGGSVLRLPPGYFLDEPTWTRRDAELKDAQDKVTRLKAENESFRKDAAKVSWAPIVGTAISVIGCVLIYRYME